MRKLMWKINRLKSMSFWELLWRVRDRTTKILEYYRYYSISRPIYEMPIPQKFSNLNINIKSLPINLNNDVFDLFEEIKLLGDIDYNKYKKTWNAGFNGGKDWPIDDFSYSINISQREDIGDIRMNWELNRHYQFVGLAKNYYVTRNKSYLDELEKLFDDWNSKNHFLHGVQWNSPMEISIRCMSWIYMYAFLKETSADEIFLKRIENGIKFMAYYVSIHQSKYSSANNHLIVEMLCVGFAGVLFGCSNWIKIAIDTLSQELMHQNYRDGINKEMSLHYQAFVMEAYGLMCLLLEKNNISIPNKWEEMLQRMAEYLFSCCGEYGEVIEFGDNDEGKILDFKGNMFDYYSYVLQLMGVILDSKYTNCILNENIYWLIERERVERHKKQEVIKKRLVYCFKEGGYSILRSRDSKVIIGIDHAVLGYEKLAAHAHADALSIQVFNVGKPVLYDPGTFSYHLSKKLRDEFRKTVSHNTVVVDNLEQAKALGPFLWGDRYDIVDFKIESYSDRVELNGCIEYSGVKHRRNIVYNFGNKIVIDDYVEGAETAKQIWNIDVSMANVNSYGADSYECENTYISRRYGIVEPMNKLNIYFKNRITTEIYINN